MTNREFLTDIELDVIHFVERQHSATGETPGRDVLKQRFNVSESFINEFETNPLVLKSMQARGIIYPAPKDQFTPEMMHAAAAILDPLDRRSDGKKLADIGISTRQWSQWVQDRNFAEYLRQRSELMLSNSIHEAHRGLIKGMRNGNVASIKTYYEITGRHDPSRESQVDIRRILSGFIEVIQRHISDPIILHRIATELSNMSTRESYANSIVDSMTDNRPAIQGQVMTAPSFGDLDE